MSNCPHNHQVADNYGRTCAAGGAKATISMNMGLEVNSVGGGGVNMTQALYDAKQRVCDLIKTSIITREPTPDLLPILQNAGWTVSPQ